MQLVFAYQIMTCVLACHYVSAIDILKPNFVPYCTTRDKCKAACNCEVRYDCRILEMDDPLRQSILFYHNQIRDIQSAGEPIPGGMTMLQYDVHLEEISKCWASRCENEYSECFITSRFNETSQSVVQVTIDIDQTPKMSLWMQMMNFWLGQAKSISAETLGDLPAGERGERIHNFAQLLSDRVRFVGCAWSILNYTLTFVCTYGPRGPLQGEAIYQIGHQCSLCPKGYGCDKIKPFPRLCKAIEAPTLAATPPPPPPIAPQPVVTPPSASKCVFRPSSGQSQSNEPGSSDSHQPLVENTTNNSDRESILVPDLIPPVPMRTYESDSDLENQQNEPCLPKPPALPDKHSEYQGTDEKLIPVPDLMPPEPMRTYESDSDQENQQHEPGLPKPPSLPDWQSQNRGPDEELLPVPGLLPAVPPLPPDQTIQPPQDSDNPQYPHNPQPGTPEKPDNWHASYLRPDPRSYPVNGRAVSQSNQLGLREPPFIPESQSQYQRPRGCTNKNVDLNLLAKYHQVQQPDSHEPQYPANSALHSQTSSSFQENSNSMQRQNINWQLHQQSSYRNSDPRSQILPPMQHGTSSNRGENIGPPIPPRPSTSNFAPPPPPLPHSEHFEFERDGQYSFSDDPRSLLYNSRVQPERPPSPQSVLQEMYPQTYAQPTPPMRMSQGILQYQKDDKKFEKHL